jgi:DNA polymerase III alpha subunit
MSLVVEDFSLSEMLGFEEEYLGYYLHSPLDLYECVGNCSIEDAKEYSDSDRSTRLEGVIVSVDYSKTKNDKDFAKIIISDGVQQTLVLMWDSEMRQQNRETLKPGVGVQLYVNYDETRNIFTVARNETIIRLKRKNANSK